MLLRQGTEVDDEDFYLACVLGWCVEWVNNTVIPAQSLAKQNSVVSVCQILVLFIMNFGAWILQLQASALVLDDITDNAYTRRDNLCWYKLPTVRSITCCVLFVVDLNLCPENDWLTEKCSCNWQFCQVGMSAINDGVLLKCHVQAIIKRYFKEKFYFLDLMELWNEVIGGPEQTQNLLGFHL